MSEDNVKPGTDGRPSECYYFKEDHERAAAYIREEVPAIFTMMKEHSGAADMGK